MLLFVLLSKETKGMKDRQELVQHMEIHRNDPDLEKISDYISAHESCNKIRPQSIFRMNKLQIGLVCKWQKKSLSEKKNYYQVTFIFSFYKEYKQKQMVSRQQNMPIHLSGKYHSKV
jgi:hypothetical protein